MKDELSNLYETVKSRKSHVVENSYTCYLFDEGLNKILKKCGEECSEVIIASKDGQQEPLKNEICDLFYHIIVLMVNQGIELKDIYSILAERSQKIGNRKVPHQTDHNS